MKSELGFDVATALMSIGVDIDNWDSLQKSKSGGATWYQDSLFGEQSFNYNFLGGKLLIEFDTSYLLCVCEDLVSCNCEELLENEFNGWSDYWDATHETVVLTKKQVVTLFTPNLFSKT